MQVNARALLINKKVLGADPLVDKILNEPESAEAKLYALVVPLSKSSLKRSYIEASFLASQDTSAISEVLEIPLETLEMYHDIFYQVRGLDKLSKMELLETSDKSESLLKIWAMSQGLDFIAWRLGKPVDISPVEGLQDLFTTCIYKSKEALFNGNVSSASIESTKWVKLSMDLARLLKVWVLDSSAAKRDIELALKEVVPDFQGIDSLIEDESFSSNSDLESNIDLSTSLSDLK